MAKQNNNNGNYTAAQIKAAEKMDRLLKNASKSGFDFSESMGKSTGFIDSISSQLLGIGKSDFFEKIKRSSDDISNINNEVEILKEAFSEAAEVANKGFKETFKEMNKGTADINQSMKSFTDKLSQSMPEIAKEIQDAFKSKNLANLSDDAMKQFKKMVKDKEGFGALNDFLKTDAVKKIKGIKKELAGWEDELKKDGAEVFNLDKGLNSMLERLTKNFSVGAIWESLKGFDNILTKAQMDSGILFKENSGAMADLTAKTQVFGMGIAETTELMSSLGAGLRTTDFNVLSQAAGDMAAIGKATGLSSTEVGELGSQMMLMGKSSEDVNSLAESTMKSAMNFGVNGKKVMQDIVKNLPKFRQMGFQGGEESLKRMALQAERMGQNIDEIFDMSKKARTIEGALDMASQLQLASGSFSNINPMDLLSAARKGPLELQKILGQMGKDIGNFDEKTGKMDFGAVDIDRLQIVADATGMSIDSLEKQITKTAQDTQKQKFISPDLFSGMDPEQKAFLLDKIGKDGKLTMSVDGISDITKLNSTNISNAMKQADIDKGNLEDQAKQNISFQDSLTNLKTSIMNAFVIFEPAIITLTRGLQWFTEKTGSWGKFLIAGLAAVFALAFSAGKQVFNGMMFRKGFDKGSGTGGIMGTIKGFFGKGKGASETLCAPETGVKGESGGGLKGFATAIKEMSKEGVDIDMKGIFKLSGSILLLVAPIGILATIFSKVSPALLLAFGGVMVEMALAMLIMSKITGQISIGNVLKGALAMVILGAALIPFAFAMQMFSGVSWETLGVAAVAILGAALLLSGLGFFAPLILMGALVLAAAGLSLMVFGASLLVASAGFNAISKIDWSSLSGMGPALLTIAAAGALGLVGSFGILGMAFSLGALASVMVVLAPALQLASISMSSMAEGIQKLNESVKSIDTAKLESLASSSERLSTASAISGLSNVVSGMFGGGKEEKAQKIEIAPIVINLKLNGRQIDEIRINDIQTKAN